VRALGVWLLIAAAGCVDRLPDQDRRITVTPAAFKLSAEFLWKEYKGNQTEADRKYWGKALAVTGVVTRLGDDGAARIVFEQESPLGVEANLLEDQAKDILAEAKPGERLTLKCYCSGLSTNVILKSCVRP
jgi:hypothetical protein